MGVLVTAGLVGLIVGAYLLIVRSSLRRDEDGGRAERPRPAIRRPGVDPDAMLLRILDDPRLGDLAAARLNRGEGERP